MVRFVVAPHVRLQDWVAEEKGSFAAEGLDCEFRETMDARGARAHRIGNRVASYANAIFMPAAE